MISNYVKVARRNLVQNKLYAFINILGLTIAITCCLFIYLFVTNELKTDDFHENGDRIHRVIRIMYDDGVPRKVGITSAPFRDAIINDFEGIVEEAVRIMPSDGLVTIEDGDFMEDRLYITDANFFEVFSWPLVQGNSQTALEQPNTVVLSESTARKYFGTEDQVGKTIRVDGDTEFEVTGVFRKPENSRSHIEFDLLASMETFRTADFYSGWWWNNMHTYVMLPQGANPEDLEARFPDFMEKYFGENMAQNNRRIDLELQPMKEIYFADDTTFDWSVSHGSRTILYMFSIIALLIIGVACVNFVNMATARSVNRAREIGIRKTLGAQRFNLMMQFLGEALLMTLAAGLLSFGSVHTLLPLLEQVTDTALTVSLFSGEVIGSAFIFLLLTGLLAGENRNETYTLKTLFTDHNFGEVLDVEFLAGRDFDPSYGTDFEQAVIINRKVAEMFSWSPKEALGKRFENQFLDSTARVVIGVVENFHYESMHQSIAPLVVSMNPDQREILVKVQTDNLEQTLVGIKSVWSEFSPLFPLEYFFLDQQFSQLYENDRRQRSVFTAFSFIAIFIACMGLFSLAAFNAEKRRKEMGVRKVLGANFGDILLLFNREVLTVVAVSFLLSVPAAWFLAEQWLQNYAYRVPNGMINYLLAGVVILILSVLTVSYQSFKIAKTNPVESLKSE